MNKIKDIENPEQENMKQEKANNFFIRNIRPILDGSIISRERTEKNFPFIFYIILLIILFISNTFHAQDTQREIIRTKEEVKVLRIKSIYVKSLLMESTRPTKMAELVKGMGLKESEVPPQKIIVKQ
jgi:cell division protein FtsL